MVATTTCQYSGAVHYDATVHALAPLDATDANGTAFQFASSTCVYTEPQIASTTPFQAQVTTNILLLVLAAIALLDLFRRVFARQS